MKTMNLNQWGKRQLSLAAGAALAAVLLCGVTGCSTTRQARSVTPSGFLGSDVYALMKPGTGDQAKLRYVRPDVDWAKFTKVDIEPVQLWTGEKDSQLAKLSEKDQETLTSFFYTSLVKELGKNMTVVNQPGPDTLVVRAAITEAKKCRPVSNLTTTLVPFGVALNLLKTVAFGKGIGVGDVQVEGAFYDGGDNELVAAAVDRRVGTKALRTKFDGTWGDVKLAFSYWAWKTDAQLVALKAGTDKNVDNLMGN